MDTREMILKNAELVIEQMRPVSGLAFTYDAESVQWVDGYINRQRERPQFATEMIDVLENVLGSYLGECVRRTYGGEWIEDEHGWCVRFSKEDGVYPFNKTRKQLENGAGESIYGFFTMIPVVYGHASPLLEGRASPITNGFVLTMESADAWTVGEPAEATGQITETEDKLAHGPKKPRWKFW